MKLVLLALVGMVSLGAQAQIPDPESLCKVQKCTEKMQEIVTDFTERGTLPDFSAGPMVASGSCFYNERSIDPEQENHGLNIISGTIDQPAFQGLFSYWTKQDPWQGMTYEQANNAAVQGGSKPAPATVEGNSIRTDFHQSAWLVYWARQDKERNELLMVAYKSYPDFNAITSAYCRLKIH